MTAQAHPAMLQHELERSYGTAIARGMATSAVPIRAGNWNYTIDVVNMVQTNVEHAARTQRAVRRRANPNMMVF